LSRTERLALVEREGGELSLKNQAELLGISRSSLYYQPVEPSAEEVRLKHRIDEIYTRYPFYGSRRIRAILNREEWHINRKRVQRCMREMGLVAVYPGPNLSKPAPDHKIYPYLLRNVTASYPNHLWGVDITYIRLQKGWMYLVAILDWYSRYVVSWVLDQTLEMPFVLDAVDYALAQATPEIINSDQGSHFTSAQYLDRFLAVGSQISMDGRGRAMDNIFTERLWRSVKYEEVYLNEYLTPRQARQGLTDYFHFYNYERPHQALDYLTPAELYSTTMNVLTNKTNGNERTATNETNGNEQVLMNNNSPTLC
jgi:putative transposase